MPLLQGIHPPTSVRLSRRPPLVPKRKTHKGDPVGPPPGRRPLQRLPPARPTPATPLGREIDFGRVGHNHWALKQITDKLTQARRTGVLEDHVEAIVAAYEQATPLRNYAAAVRLAFNIGRATWP